MNVHFIFEWVSALGPAPKQLRIEKYGQWAQDPIKALSPTDKSRAYVQPPSSLWIHLVSLDCMLYLESPSQKQPRMWGPIHILYFYIYQCSILSHLGPTFQWSPKPKFCHQQKDIRNFLQVLNAFTKWNLQRRYWIS